jgi:sortilin
LYPGWEKSIHYVVTLDLFASPFAKVVPCGNLFEIMSGKVFLAVPSDCPIGPDGKAHKAGSGAISSRSITLYVSDGDGDEFVEACLPALLEDDGYNLVYTHDESAAFVLADHAEPGSWSAEVDSPTSDAYAPAYNASLHTMSLADVYRREFVTDFSRIEGVPVRLNSCFIEVKNREVFRNFGGFVCSHLLESRNK